MFASVDSDLLCVLAAEAWRRNCLHLEKLLTSKDNPRVDSRSAQLGKSLSTIGKLEDQGSICPPGDARCQLRDELHVAGIRLYFSRVADPVRVLFDRSGFLATPGKDRVFFGAVHSTVNAFLDRAAA